LSPAASVERAVTEGAVILFVAGAALALGWGVFRRRSGLLRWPLLVLAAGLLVAGATLGAWAWHENRSRTVRGSPTVEFLPNKPPGSARSEKVARDEPWPTYGRDGQRTHFSPFDHRPPYDQVWSFQAYSYVEYPPTVAYGRVYIAQERGRFWAVDADTGKVLWKRRLTHCAAASPTIADGVVYQAFMHQLPCQAHVPGARGFLIAWNARTGRKLWTFPAGAIESTPLVVGRNLYFGAWDHRLYSLSLGEEKRPRLRWTFTADDEIVAAPAYADGTVYVATSGGSLYALDARTGRVRWRGRSFARFGSREYFYATPTVAYGRVYIGNADGTVYAFGARSGRLLWARQVGTYVYTGAAVWRRTVYVGTWDGYFVALDAATGDVRWKHDSQGGITGGPTVMGGLVYYSSVGRLDQAEHQRHVEAGRPRTFALDARSGRLVWSFPDGKFSPLVADEKRVYLIGENRVYALVPKNGR
jgi:outer membrane protein assembly factor BamB